MILKKNINNEKHLIEFLNVNSLKSFLNNEIVNIDILLIDKNIIKNTYIKKIFNNFSKRSILLRGNEKIKSLYNFNFLIEKILKKGIERKSKLISIGGGTIGDLSGFIASSLLRGIDHIMIPTSLLAMVDSSVGGKTGVNSIYGKNLIGSFYLPKKVIICSDLLKTLPVREINCGFAEIIKYSYIHPNLFGNKIKNFKTIYKSNIFEIIKLSVRAKLKYVNDFREKSNQRNSRAILNFGHTVGHAIENSKSYDGSMKHGEAIALGMIIELSISKYLNYYKGSIEDFINILQKFNLPTNYKDYLTTKNINNLMKKMKFDKKTYGQSINFICIDNKGGFVKKILFKDLKKLLLKIN